jgi:hypothetical protein
MQTSFVPVLENRTSSRAWLFWSGIVASSLGSLVILDVAAGLAVFGRAWSFVFVLAAPLFGLMALLDLVGLGVAYEGWRSLAIEIAIGGVLCLIGAGLVLAHHWRVLRSSAWR